MIRYLLISLFLLLYLGCHTKKSVSGNTDGGDTLTYYATVELPVKARLGEGSIWNWKTSRLWWIDIESKQLNIYDPETGKNETINVGQWIGTAVPAQNGDAILALQDGIYRMDLATHRQTLICNPESGLDNMRFNDGKCDPAGRLWVGSMSLKYIKGAASLYRISMDGSYKKMIDSVTVSNGIVWTSDHKTMYYTDTPTRCIRAYDYNEATGKISNARIAVTIPSGLGAPDGMTIDAENKLWVAHWGGHMVGRWDPLTGRLMARVEVPALNVTSCAFGGPNLGILYITSSGQGMKKELAQRYPEAGDLFKVNPGVHGVKADFWGN